MTPGQQLAIAIAGLAFTALNFLLTLYFVVFKLGRWMGKMDEFKKHVKSDISVIKGRVFGEGSMWRPMTELADARSQRKKH